MKAEMKNELRKALETITETELEIGKYPCIDTEYVNALIRAENALAYVLNNSDKI
jgi:cell division FtsZ-interacting protein ZapD